MTLCRLFTLQAYKPATSVQVGAFLKITSAVLYARHTVNSMTDSNHDFRKWPSLGNFRYTVRTYMQITMVWYLHNGKVGTYTKCLTANISASSAMKQFVNFLGILEIFAL